MFLGVIKELLVLLKSKPNIDNNSLTNVRNEAISRLKEVKIKASECKLKFLSTQEVEPLSYIVFKFCMSQGIEAAQEESRGEYDQCIIKYRNSLKCLQYLQLLDEISNESIHMSLNDSLSIQDHIINFKERIKIVERKTSKPV